MTVDIRWERVDTCYAHPSNISVFVHISICVFVCGSANRTTVTMLKFLDSNWGQKSGKITSKPDFVHVQAI